MTIKELSEEIENVSKGYTEKFGIKRDANWFILKLQEELGELTQSYLMLSGSARTKGKSKKELQVDFNKEVADVFCHILLLAKYYDIDLGKEIERKWLIWNKKGESLS